MTIKQAVIEVIMDTSDIIEEYRQDPKVKLAILNTIEETL